MCGSRVSQAVLARLESFVRWAVDQCQAARASALPSRLSIEAFIVEPSRASIRQMQRWRKHVGAEITHTNIADSGSLIRVLVKSDIQRAASHGSKGFDYGQT